MEDKRVLDKEMMELVSGGSGLAADSFASLAPAKQQEFLARIEKVDVDSMELPVELLDKITGGSVFGGELNDWDKDYLDACIVDYKAHGVDLEKTLRYMQKSNFSNEALWYVGTHW